MKTHPFIPTEKEKQGRDRWLLAWQDINYTALMQLSRSGSFAVTLSAHWTQLIVFLGVLFSERSWFHSTLAWCFFCFCFFIWAGKSMEQNDGAVGVLAQWWTGSAHHSRAGLSGGCAWEELYMYALLQQSHWLREGSARWCGSYDWGKTVHAPSFLYE